MRPYQTYKNAPKSSSKGDIYRVEKCKMNGFMRFMPNAYK